MKKLIISAIVVLGTLSATAQQKGFYLTAGGSLGANNFRYALDNNKSVPQLGFGGSLGLQYFFTKHWGLGTGIGLSFYNSKGDYSNSSQNDPVHYSFGGMHDDDPGPLGNDYKNYNLMLGLNDWTETQKGYFLEVPLMLMYQTKWGASEKVGMYFGIGAKVQIPIISQEYEVKDGSQLSVSAYYPTPDMTLPDPNGPDMSNHGYGTNSKTGFNGDMDLKTGFAATGELGFLFSLSRRVDLTLGAYLDYGFTDIKNGNKTDEGYLINPENRAKTIQPSAYVGDNLQYNGYVNSYAVDKVNLFGVGGKVGLRIKLGKIKKDEKVAENKIIEHVAKPEKYLYNLWVLDSLTRQPILTQVNINCQDCPKTDVQGFYSSDKDTTKLDLYPANTYKIAVTKLGFPVYNTQFTTTPEQRNITLLMPLHPRLGGTVKNNQNKVLPEVSIQVRSNNEKNYNALTDNDGNFNIPSIDAGVNYVIVASKAGYVSDTITLDIPSAPDKLQPSYVVMRLDNTGMQLFPVKKIIMPATVLFDFDKWDLRPEAKVEIKTIIPMLNENPNVQISVDGHTDVRGSAKYNQTLSEKRANSVRDFMIEQGITPNRVKARGYGFTHLLNHCKPKVQCTEEEHQENRRVEFIFNEK